MPWRPKSIVQLVLIGITIVIAPLCAAILYTVQALDQQAVNANTVTRELVALTRQSQRLQTDLVDLERLARQYATLDDAKLLPLFETTLATSHHELDLLEQQLDSTLQQITQTLSNQLIMIAEGVQSFDRQYPDSYSLLAQFDLINQHNRQLQRAVTEHVDRQLKLQVQQVNRLKTSLRNWLILVAALTLAAALLLIYWINTPIRQIEHKIRALGDGERQQQICISGPVELRALGQQLDWLRDQLDQLEEQKRQFLRHMSHELKTPLASLREGADLMVEGVLGDLDEKQQEVIGIIQQNSRELQRLIENMLDFNHSLEQSSLHYQQVALLPLCQELLTSYHVQIERRQLRLQLPAKSQCCFADPGKFKTALDNLISNAVNYCDQEGTVLIGWQSVDNNFQVYIANSGQPIATEESSRIFRPFYQGSASRDGAIKGSGIGLSVARECIQAQGGTLELIDKAGWSSCFQITLPVISDSEHHSASSVHVEGHLTESNNGLPG